MEKKIRICIDCAVAPAHHNSKCCWDCRVVREKKYREEYSIKQQERSRIWYANLTPEQKREIIHKRNEKNKRVVYDGRMKEWE